MAIPAWNRVAPVLSLVAEPIMLALQRAEHTPPQSVVSVSHVGKAAVVSLNFPVIRERQANLLEGPLSDLCDLAQGRVAMDLSQVTSFSCAWINALICLTRRCRTQGGELVLFGMDAASARTIRDTGLLDHLVLERDKASALKALGEEPVSNWRLAVARMLDIPVAIPESQGLAPASLAPGSFSVPATPPPLPTRYAA